MAIVEGPRGTQADLVKVTWDLVEAFATLARVSARNCTADQGRDLLAVSERLHRHALLFEREELADRLEQTSVRLAAAAQI